MKNINTVDDHFADVGGGITESIFSKKDLVLSFLVPGYAIKKWVDVRRAGYNVPINQDLIIEGTKMLYILEAISYFTQ